MSLILTVNGKKGSGKDTTANYILGLVMISNGIIRDSFHMTDEGKLWISDLFGDKAHEGIVDLNREFSESAQQFLNEEIYPHIKIYSFADEIKAFCMNVLNLSWSSVHGSNEEKNALTHILWENFAANPDNKTGPMSGREVMQHFGSDIVRKMYGPAWAKATLKKVKRENPAIAIIKDGRFPDEVEETTLNGGLNIRLTKQVYEDGHISETACDPDNFDWTKYDYIIDNQTMSIKEQCSAVYNIFEELNLITQ